MLELSFTPIVAIFFIVAKVLKMNVPILSLKIISGEAEKCQKCSRLFKPKFQYADFATFTETSPRGKSRDTNGDKS